MNKQLKNKWISALRSGEFQQARKALKTDEHGPTQHCCLGVLREVAGKPWGPKYRSGEYANTVGHESRYGSLHDVELSEFGLTDSEHGTLYEMNDGGSSFNEIADYIESRL